MLPVRPERFEIVDRWVDQEDPLVPGLPAVDPCSANSLAICWSKFRRYLSLQPPFMALFKIGKRACSQKARALDAYSRLDGLLGCDLCPF